MGSVVAGVVGVVFALVGLAMIRNARGFGTAVVRRVPEFFRVGTEDSYRSILGGCWLAGGILVLVLALAGA